jgi:Tol biopolymer transport system component
MYDGSNKVNLANPDNDWSPTFSPNGRRIATLREETRQSALWLMDADGGLAPPDRP